MISHHHKCIFIHIPKNAGQSIEMVFVKLLGLSWLDRAPLLLRYNDRPALGPPKLAHLTAQEYVTLKYVPQEMFDAYFKFAFVRNPWSRMVSIYNFLGFDRRYEFKRFLSNIYLQEVWDERYWFVRPQCDFLLSEDGELLVDFVGRFESLHSDFEQVCEHLGLPRLEVPHVNQTPATRSRRSRNPRQVWRNMIFKLREHGIPRYSRFQDYYDAEAMEIVADLYKRDVENFGYRFE